MTYKLNGSIKLFEFHKNNDNNDTSMAATMELIFAKAFRNVGPITSLWNPYLKKAMSTLQKIKILIVQQIHFT